MTKLHSTLCALCLALPAQARELQFSKDRFGRGDWRIRFDLNAVMGSDGLWHTVRYPSAEGEERLWATINTLRPRLAEPSTRALPDPRPDRSQSPYPRNCRRQS